MIDTKPWWQSNGAWANLLQVVTSFAAMYHLVSKEQAAVIVADAPSMIVTFVMLILGAWGLWGRVRATRMIALTPPPPGALN